MAKNMNNTNKNKAASNANNMNNTNKSAASNSKNSTNSSNRNAADKNNSKSERSHVKTAVNIPYEEIQRCRRFPKDKLLVLYCSRGSSSLFAARELMKMGYTVKSVVGGIRCYRGSNLYFSNVHSKIKK